MAFSLELFCVERFRDRVAHWLADFDTRLMEVGLAGSAIINGVQAAARDENNSPLAPFLNSALSSLSYYPSLWNVILIGAGIAQLVALAWGTGRGAMRPRIWMAFVSMALWWLIVAAIVTGQQPPFTCARYVWAASLSFFVYVVLSIHNRATQQFQQGHEEAPEAPKEVADATA